MIIAGSGDVRLVPRAEQAGRRFFRMHFALSSSLEQIAFLAHAGERFCLGLALGFLPCGLIYAALLKCVATRVSPWGAATMVAFG